eukprot:TRINITY_DN16243_c0_g2_i2.p1 TRINITY_DN16243_c0_g2~~TRINITY_DN16243_c0_g2_i2.p1  ORF type:complete len:408 (-),score=128.39 TRINITY_DN16243_c0_g2_i2:52-1275(-)
MLPAFLQTLNTSRRTKVHSLSIFRRQLSCLMSKQSVPTVLMQEEIEDIWYLLEICHQAKEAKGMTVCLELLDSSYHSPPTLLRQATTAKSLELLNALALSETTSEINLTLAKKALLKLEEAKIKEASRGPVQETEVALTKTFDQPPSLRVCLFQLAESNDLERVTFLLQTIAQFGGEESAALQKSGVRQKVVRVVHKYCNGDYEFDQEVTKLGSFQYCLLQCLISLSESFKDFDEFLAGGIFGMLGQIAEEAFIYTYDKAINSWLEWNNRLPSFITLCLRFFELGVHADCVKYYEEMGKVYRALAERIEGLAPQEVSVGKVYKALFGGRESERAEKDKSVKAVSPVLHAAYRKIKELMVKLDAVKEYSETHREKYEKLFGGVGKQQETLDILKNKACLLYTSDAADE